MKNLIWFIGFLVFCSCEELSFTNEDIKASTEKSKTTEAIKKHGAFQTENKAPVFQEEKDTPIIKSAEQIASQITEEIPPQEKPFLDEEITLISEDLELTEDAVIQNGQVVLDMVTIKTFEYDLFIIAEEFVSNHSIIRNFSEGGKAKKLQNGRNGGSEKGCLKVLK
ncbi:MAG: hypothetical protein OXJ52_04730 [Oligoflexia bacterium]|nr:hypothetical protein [Oligoflexia bacterium]